MPRPTRDAPIAMLMCVAIGGVTYVSRFVHRSSKPILTACRGLSMIIVLLFCIPDPEAILTTLTGNPLIELIIQATESRTAGVVMSCALAVCFINGTIGSVTSGSRLLWAMGRDGGAPCSKLYVLLVHIANLYRWCDANRTLRMSRIDRRFNVPVNAILAVALFNILFGLLYLGPSVAFNAYISSCTIFLNCSYAGPIIILLVRGRNTIMLERPDFPLGRVGGYILNYVSVIYVIVTSAVNDILSPEPCSHIGKSLTMLQQFFLLPATAAVDTVTMSKCSWLPLYCFRVLTFVQTTSQL